MRGLLAALLLLAPLSHGVARRLTPYPDPDALRAAWDYARSCSGAEPQAGHDFAQMTVLVTPLLLEGRHHIKARWSEGDTIVVDSASVGVPWVIRHEMLHALLQNPDHPMEPFAFPCKVLEVQNQ